MKFFIIFITFLISGCAGGLYNTGDYDQAMLQDSQLVAGSGAVTFSTRVQMQTTNNIYFYFIEEGADRGDKSQMIQIYRAAGVPIVGTYATTREYQVLNALPGKYKLYAHTIGYFPDIRPNASVTHSKSTGIWAGQIYGDGGVSFEVFENKTTYIGDLWLEQPEIRSDGKYSWRNQVVRIGEPRIDEVRNFIKDYKYINQEIIYNSEVSSLLKSKVKCDYIQKKLFTPWECPPEA